MVRYVFDACAIINLLKRGTIESFLHGATLDLAMYETLNALWKEYKLLKKLDRVTFEKLVGILRKIFNILEICSIKDYENLVIDIACKEEITVYDASYLALAIKKNAILITDDRDLYKVAVRYVSVKSSKEVV